MRGGRPRTWGSCAGAGGGREEAVQKEWGHEGQAGVISVSSRDFKLKKIKESYISVKGRAGGQKILLEEGA